jgi:hypothetical protein
LSASNKSGAGWLEPGETMRYRMAEFPPALMLVPPFSIVLAPLGSVPVELRGRGPWLGQYLAVRDEKVWIIASAESIQPELAAANGR